MSRVHYVITAFAQWALRPNPELTGVPNALDLAKTDAETSALRLVLARLDIGRPFFLPPNVPAERVAMLRVAFDATMTDPADLEEARKLEVDIDPLAGADRAGRADRQDTGRHRRTRARRDGATLAGRGARRSGRPFLSK